MATLTFSKEELLSQLRHQRAKAARLDEKVLAAHKRDEEAWAKKQRAAIVDLAKVARSARTYKDMLALLGWTPDRYLDGREYHRQARMTLQESPPACPVPLVRAYDAAIHTVSLSNQTRYRLNSESDVSKQLFHLCNRDFDARPQAPVC